MRHATSCSTCRLRKKRCIQASSDSACVFCSARDHQCDLARLPLRTSAARSRKSGQAPRPVLLRKASMNTVSSNSSGNDVDMLQSTCDAILQLPVCSELVELYFDLFHNKQQILFQRQAFLSQRSNNQLHDYILLGIIALTARFSKHSYFQAIPPLERAAGYLARALTLFNTRADAVSTQALQGCILLSFVCFVENQYDQSSLLAAQATCMVHLLGLPERLVDNVVDREINIRLFWQAWMMETWNATPDRRPRLLNARQGLPRPLTEETFESLELDIDMGFSSYRCEASHQSIWSKVVDLTDTLADVMHAVKTLVEQPYARAQLEVNIQHLASHLSDWKENLPEHFKNTIENRKQFRDLGRGREFAVLHLIFHYQNLILFFPYLATYTASYVSPETTISPNESTHAYADYCKAHACALSELMWTTNTTPGMECLWSPLNGHLLVIASTVHLHSLLFDQSSTGTTYFRNLLEQNFVMLLQLQSYWPTLKYSLLRLEAIHKACQQGYGLKAFRMDAWMLAFLCNYNSDVTERHAAMDPKDHITETLQEIPWATELEWSSITAKAMDIGSELNASLTFDLI